MNDAVMERQMAVTVREMTLGETVLRIRYFHDASPEYLELLGVDPTRLMAPPVWEDYYRRNFSLPLEQRPSFELIWLLEDRPIGFSTADKIVFGDQAFMHLHIIDPDERAHGAGVECVRWSVEIYFDRLKLRTLFCEPNAFNVAPNRTLQKAGFSYVKTHMTVPSPLNFHQAVTRWAIKR
jgi:RimJ/RimL family protein N-acetyltransferase